MLCENFVHYHQTRIIFGISFADINLDEDFSSLSKKKKKKKKPFDLSELEEVLPVSIQNCINWFCA